MLSAFLAYAGSRRSALRGSPHFLNYYPSKTPWKTVKPNLLEIALLLTSNNTTCKPLKKDRKKVHKRSQARHLSEFLFHMVLLAQMKQLSLKAHQHFSVFGACFDVSNIIISHYEYVVKIYKMLNNKDLEMQRQAKINDKNRRFVVFVQCLKLII